MSSTTKKVQKKGLKKVQKNGQKNGQKKVKKKAIQATCAYCEIEVDKNPATDEWYEWCPNCIVLLEEQAFGEWYDDS
jgi:hypothetical protein